MNVFTIQTPLRGVSRRTGSAFASALLLVGPAAVPATLAGIVTVAPARAAGAAPKPVARIKARPGHVIGQVTNAAGRPLAGAEVSIYGTTIAGANTSFAAKTDAAGRFSQRVPEGIYGVSAYYQTTFNGKNYRFTLAPKDGTTAKQHDSAPGIVKQFIWKITGLKPGEQPGEAGTHTEPLKYYGAALSVTSKSEGFGGDKVYFPAGAALVVALAPRGPLIDGSAGRPLTFRLPFDKDVTGGIPYWYPTNIPVGRYTLQATLVSPGGGASRPLNAKRSLDFSGPFAPVVNVDFEPTSFGDLQTVSIMVEP